MKNFRLFSVVASIMMMTATFAQTTNSIFGVDASIRKGKTGDLVIKYQLDQEGIYAAYEFYISLPEGITISTAEGDAISNIGFNTCSVVLQSDGSYKVMGANNPTNEIPGLTGTLLTLKLEADPSIAVDADLDAAEIKGGFLAYKTGEGGVDVDPTTFNISIVEVPTVILNESSTEDPEPNNDVNVKVIRTINADEWSTICLPFAMDEDQVKAAFGDDVVLGDFTGCTTTKSGSDVTSITVNFNEATSILANHPYIIKVSEAKKDFSVEDVDILEGTNLTINQDENIQEIDLGDGDIITRKRYNQFIGTYKANTILPKNSLFLNGNKFWYSNDEGKTKMKGFRGYFKFYENLKDKELNSNIALSFDEADGINNVTVGQPAEGIYDIQGRKVHTDENKWDNLKKGVYIINGKKIVK